MSISLILLLVVTLVRLAIFAFVIYAAVQGVKALRKYNRSGEVRKEKAETRRSLGEVLKEHRVRCKMTQEFVAESLGVSRQAVSKWETGTADPSTSNLLALAKLFGVSAEELRVRDIIGSKYPAVRITVTMDALLESAMNQNFIPVIDDLDNFIGIVTRRDIISYLAKENENSFAPPVSKIG